MGKQSMWTQMRSSHTHNPSRHRRVSNCSTVLRKQTWDIPPQSLTAGKSPVREINRGHLTLPPFAANTPISNTEFLPVSALRARLLILFATG